MVPPNTTQAQKLEVGEVFKVLNSSNTGFYPKKYTLTLIEVKGGFIYAHCSYTVKQFGKKYTEHTWFGGQTKVRKVTTSH